WILPGNDENSCAVDCRFSILRLAMTTFAPAAAKRSVIALPMPRPPPVTTATFPCRLVVALMGSDAPWLFLWIESPLREAQRSHESAVLTSARMLVDTGLAINFES